MSISPAEQEPVYGAREVLPGPPSVHREVAGRRTVLHVGGEVDLASVELVRSEIGAALESSPAELWIDLCATAFIDSSGLHVIVEAAHESRRRGLRLAIICPPGPVRRVFELTGLDRALPLYDDDEAKPRTAQ